MRALAGAGTVVLTALVTVLVTVLVMIVATSRATLAAFTDDAELRTGALTAAELLPPTKVTCTNGPLLSGYVDIGWTRGSDGATHRVEVERSAGTWVAMGTAAPESQTFRITSSQVASLLSLGVTYRLRVTATAGSGWSSTPSGTVSISTVSILGLGLAASCA